MRLLAACLLCLPLTVHAEPAPAATAMSPSLADTKSAAPHDSLPGSALPLRARLDRDAIRAAIADLPAEGDADPRRRQGDAPGDALSATPYQEFSKDFAKSRLPICLHSEGLKNQPTFFLTGWIALPFVAVAKLRGVCR